MGRKKRKVRHEDAEALRANGSVWQRFKQFPKSKLLHVNDSPERIARGVAVAWWVTFALAPLLGTHIWVALLLAFVFRANKISMLAFMWVHNPVTMWPILYINARVGSLVTRLWQGAGDTGMAELAEFLRRWEEEGVLASVRQGDFWRRLFDVMMSVGAEVWIGGAILGALACMGSYYATKHIVVFYRRKRSGWKRHTTTIE
jgi:uncharacterized protein (DUF2062 family)